MTGPKEPVMLDARRRSAMGPGGGRWSFLADLGENPFPGSPAEFGKLIADETEKWGKVIRAAGIKAE